MKSPTTGKVTQEDGTWKGSPSPSPALLSPEAAPRKGPGLLGTAALCKHRPHRPVHCVWGDFPGAPVFDLRPSSRTECEGCCPLPSRSSLHLHIGDCCPVLTSRLSCSPCVGHLSSSPVCWPEGLPFLGGLAGAGPGETGLYVGCVCMWGSQCPQQVGVTWWNEDSGLPTSGAGKLTTPAQCPPSPVPETPPRTPGLIGSGVQGLIPSEPCSMCGALCGAPLAQISLGTALTAAVGLEN